MWLVRVTSFVSHLQSQSTNTGCFFSTHTEHRRYLLILIIRLGAAKRETDTAMAQKEQRNKRIVREQNKQKYSHCDPSWVSWLLITNQPSQYPIHLLNLVMLIMLVANLCFIWSVHVR